MSESDIYEPSESDLEKCAFVFAEAFNNYPPFVYMLPDGNTRKRKLLALHRVLVRYASRYGKIYATSKNIEGVVIILTPGSGKISPYKMILSGALRIPFDMGNAFIKRQEEIENVQERMREDCVPCNHIYLWAIAVSPSFQGKGYSKIMIEHVKKIASEMGVPIYLETAKPENVKIYEKQGFSISSSYTLGKIGIKLWGMVLFPEKSRIDDKCVIASEIIGK